jgi:hypothetical protein
MPVPRHRSDFDEYSETLYGKPQDEYTQSQYAYHPTSDRIRNFYSIFRFKFDPNYLPEEFQYEPTFTLTNNNSDPEAFTDQEYTLRYTLTRTDNYYSASGDYSLIFDWGVLGIDSPVIGTLQVGESFEIVKSKVLTGIVGSFEIDISGSASDNVVLNVIGYTQNSNLANDYPNIAAFFEDKDLSIFDTNEYKGVFVFNTPELNGWSTAKTIVLFDTNFYYIIGFGTTLYDLDLVWDEIASNLSRDIYSMSAESGEFIKALNNELLSYYNESELFLTVCKHEIPSSDTWKPIVRFEHRQYPRIDWSTFSTGYTTI